jgi:hypothetical protein
MQQAAMENSSSAWRALSGAEDQDAYKSKFEWLVKRLPHTFTGFEHDFEHVWANSTPEQRRAVLEETWEDGSLKFWLASFGELFFDAEVSEQVSEFVREKMRARLKDPLLCDILIPKDYGFGTHRVPLENGFLEAFLRPNVEVVSVRDNRIERVTPNGLQLADGTEHAFDVLIFATGFDAGTGALTRIDIRGRGGRSLKEDGCTAFPRSTRAHARILVAKLPDTAGRKCYSFVPATVWHDADRSLGSSRLACSSPNLLRRCNLSIGGTASTPRRLVTVGVFGPFTRSTRMLGGMPGWLWEPAAPVTAKPA